MNDDTKALQSDALSARTTAPKFAHSSLGRHAHRFDDSPISFQVTTGTATFTLLAMGAQLRSQSRCSHCPLWRIQLSTFPPLPLGHRLPVSLTRSFLLPHDHSLSGRPTIERRTPRSIGCGPPESTPVISTTAVEGLMEVGRQRGGLDIDDIRRALPVDAMSIEELADVLARLEEAGISVEIESTLLTPRHRNNTARCRTCDRALATQ